MIIHGSLNSKDFDQAAVDQYGLTTLHLMEIAGREVAHVVNSDFITKNKKAVVISGPGNNGGDSFVVTRFLISWGWNVLVFLISPKENYTGASLENLILLEQLLQKSDSSLQIVSLNILEDFNNYLFEFQPDVLIDGLFGVGLNRPITGFLHSFIVKINQLDLPVYSIDIASGVSADTGQLLGQAIKATKTITFETIKFGHLLYPGREYTGELMIKDIGFPPLLKNQFSTAFTYQQPRDLRCLFQSKPKNAHKGMLGKAFLLGGSKHYQGAIELSVRSCLKSGPGLVYAVYKDSLSPYLGPRLPPEAIHEIIPTNSLGEIDPQQVITFLSTIPKKNTALGIGPGIGRDTDVISMIQVILREWEGNLVVDADALYAIKNLLGQSTYSNSIILTPHLGEMAYLTGLSVESIQADLVGVSRLYANLWNCTLVLKSATTVIADPSGKIFVNQFGNVGMAKGGSGDVLTGIMTAFLAQGYSSWETAVISVCVHSLAGDISAKKWGEQAMQPSDMIELLSQTFHVINQ